MNKMKINWIDIPFEDKDNNAPQWFEYCDKKLFIPWDWRIAIDWENKKYTFDKVDGFPTLSDMKQNGEDIKLCFPFEECESPLYGFDVDNFNPQDVVDFFAEHGYKVTLKAVKNNFDAWRNDLKSGYRDDKNGYHLSSPCGCNSLRFSLSTLHPSQDWQTTYVC